MSYQKNADGDEIYTQSADNDDVIQDDRYAKDRNGDPYYPTDRNGDQFLGETVPEKYIPRGGRYTLPFWKNGDPRYEKDADDNEVYPEVNGVGFYGISRAGHEVYAKDKDGDEFYLNDVPAKKLDGTKYYAQSRVGGTIFIKDGQKDVYVGYINPDNKSTVPDKYAKDENGHEYYPQTITADGFLSDYILNHNYAWKDGPSLADRQQFYPKDAYNNEFYLPSKDLVGQNRTLAQLLVEGPNKSYAVTNDKRVILPGINGSPQTDGSVLPAIDILTNVLGILIRHSGLWSGFLTNVNVPTAPDVDPMEYSYMENFRIRRDVKPAGAGKGRQVPGLPAAAVPVVVVPAAAVPAASASTKPAATVIVKTPFYKTWYFLIMVVISLIIKSLAVWWFFLRNKSPYSIR